MWKPAALITCLGVAASVAAAAVEPLRVDGLIAAVVTPQNADGLSVNYTAVRTQAKYLSDTGVEMVFIAGTTGESLSLTIDERMLLVEEWETVAPDFGITYIVHIGAESILDVQALGAHASQHGAVAVGMMPSVFFKPATISALGAWVELAAASVPTLPLYYYHIPSQTGVDFNMYDLVVEVENRGIPNFAGVKYTGLYETRAFPDYMRAAAFNEGKYEMLCGREELTVEAMAVGTKGYIGSQFNHCGDIYAAIVAETDVAKRNAKQLAAIELLLDWINGVPAGVDGNKMMMLLAGVNVGPGRPPSVPPSADDFASLKAKVVAWCSGATNGGLFNPQPKICESVLN